jgi:DNA-binding response OmpR family regulator
MTIVPFEIMSFLIVEDDVGRLMALAEAFTESRIYNNLVGLPTGKAALEYLGAGTQHSGKTAADALIFSNVMPDMSWQELVRTIRENALFEHLRLVLMTDQSVKEVLTGDMGTAVDLILPRDIHSHELLSGLRNIPGFWCSFVKPHPTSPIKPSGRSFNMVAANTPVATV